MVNIQADTALGHLQAALSHAGLNSEVIGEFPTGDIVNVSKDGVYLYTLSVTRTDGWGEFPGQFLTGRPDLALADQPEVSAQIDRFLDDPSTGTVMERPRRTPLTA